MEFKRMVSYKEKLGATHCTQSFATLRTEIQAYAQHTA